MNTLIEKCRWISNRMDSHVFDWPSLMNALPQLGSVLALAPRRSPIAMQRALAKTPWPGAAWLVPLIHACRVSAKSIVSTEGPYEYLSFFDDKGLMCFQIFRLPDSDYFAWDNFMTPSASSKKTILLPLAAYSPCDARVFRFHYEYMSSSDSFRLDALAPKNLSQLGHQYAKNLSQRFGVPLYMPDMNCCCEKQSQYFSKELRQ